MRILPDENLDWRLARSLPGHEVESIQKNGWAEIQNGELLARAEPAFRADGWAGIQNGELLCCHKMRPRKFSRHPAVFAATLAT